MSVDLSSWWLGFLTFLLSFAAHLAWWRTKPTGRTLSALGLLFLVIPTVAYAVPLSADFVAPGILHASLSVNYIAIYPALQATSPTLALLRRMHPRGATDSELVEAAAPSLLEARIDDLVAGGLVTKKGEGIELTGRGRRLADAFHFFRVAMGLPRGEG